MSGADQAKIATSRRKASRSPGKVRAKTSQLKKLFLTVILFIVVCPSVLLGGRIFFQDDFEGGDLSGWSILDEGKVSAPSNWHISEGILVQSSNIYTSGAPQYAGTMALAGNENWTDYIFEADLRTTDNDGYGIVFRYQDSRNYYRLRLMGTDNYREGQALERVVDGEWTLKYFGRDRHGIYLDPANSRYQRIRPRDSLTVGGVVRAVVRKYH